MESLNIQEFKKQYMGKNSKWDFKKFHIICLKCNSTMVEFNGYAESTGGYYAGEHSLEGFIVVKCHECGNAFKIDLDAPWDTVMFNTDGDQIEKYHKGVESK